jgi:nitrite reductase/ring-hydroxylating ferredoxin subunit
MILRWADFPDAPAPNTPVCTQEQLQTGVTALSIGDFPILLVHDSLGTRAFVNACPHQFLPLDYRGAILGADGTHLICSNHDATFDAMSGQGLSGFGLNCGLSPVPLVFSAGMCYIGSSTDLLTENNTSDLTLDNGCDSLSLIR